MFNFIQKIFSFIYPITVFETYSEINGKLEVVMYQSKLLVNSKNTNYSYGSLEKVLGFGLKKIGPEKISFFKNILVLGVGGGSIIKYLVKKYGVKSKIIGIEIDEELINIANTFFNLNNIDHVKIINQDAKDYVATTNKKFDLIIIDLFIDSNMPEFLFSKEFIDSLKKIVLPNGYLLFNTMLPKEEKNKIKDFLDHFDVSDYNHYRYYNVEKFNDLLLIEKKLLS